MDISTDEPAVTDTAQASDHRGRGPSNGDRLWKVLAAVTAAALVAFIAYVATRSHHAHPAAFPAASAGTLPLGSTAPDFSLPRLGGGPAVSLATTRGTPTVVNFFASWCPDCQAELTAFATLASQTAGRITVIGVDANDGAGGAAASLLAQARASYPVGVDRQVKVATAYRIDALPVTYFLDAQGRVVHVAFGTQTASSLDRWTSDLTTTTGPRANP